MLDVYQINFTMKLHLPKSLRAALLACLSIFTPAVTTVSTGTIVAGTFAVTISSTAYAADYASDSAYIVQSDSDGKFVGNCYLYEYDVDYGTVNTDVVTTAWGSVMFGNSTSENAVFVFASDEYWTENLSELTQGSKTFLYDTNNLSIGGFIVLEGATGYSFAPSGTSGRIIYLQGSDLTESGRSYFNINEDFTWNLVTSSDDASASSVVLQADVDMIIAQGVTMTSELRFSSSSEHIIYLQGGGTYAYTVYNSAVQESLATAYGWNITDSSTLDLSASDAADISVAFGDYGVTLEGGTLILMDDATVTSTITVAASSNTNTLKGGGTITLSGSLCYDDENFSSLSLDGSTIALAEGFTVDFGDFVASGDYYIITDLGNDDTTDLEAFLNDEDISVLGLTGSQTAEFSIDGTSIKLTIAGEATKTVTLAGGGDYSWSQAGGWDDGASFYSGDAVVIGGTGDIKLTLSESVSVSSMTLQGSGSIEISGYAIESQSSITIDMDSSTDVIIGTVITTVDLNVQAGNIYFSDGVTATNLTVNSGTVSFASSVTGDSLSSIILNNGANLVFESGFNSDICTLSIASATSVDEAGTITLGADSSIQSISLDSSNAVLKVVKEDGVDGDVTLSIYGGALTSPSGDAALKPTLGDYTVYVGEGVTVSDNSFLYLNGGEFIVTGGGTYEVSAFYGCVSSSSTDDVVTTIAANTTFEITGTNDVASDGYYPSFWFNPNSSYTNSINVYGTFISNSSINSDYDGASITVYSGGTYQMNRGTIATTSAASNLEIEIQSGGTLALGNQDDGDTTDYSTEANITLNDGATLTGTGGVVITYHSFIYAENATVNFLANTGDTLIVTSDVAADINAEGAGTVEFTNVSFIDSIENAGTMNLNGAVTFTATSATITNTGTLSLGIDGTLTVGEEQSLNLAGTGTIDLSKASQIINNGTMTVDSTVVFDITDVASTDWVLDTTTGIYSLQLISGNAVDLSGLDVTTNLVGIDSTLTDLKFNDDGTLSYAASLDTYYYTGGTLTWAVDGSGFVTAAGTAMTYANDGVVVFTIESSTVTLGGDVEADSVTILTADDGTGINVSLTGGDYTLDCADIIILGESSLTLTDAALSSSSLISAESTTTSSLIFNGADVDFGDYGSLVASYQGNVVLTTGTLTLGSLDDGLYEFASLSTADGTLTVNDDLDLDSMSLASADTTFNGSVTVAGELNMVSTDYSADNDFYGAVTAGSITMQYGYLDFYSTVDVGSISLLGGIINFTGAVYATGEISIGNTTTTFTSTVDAASITVSNGTATFNDTVKATTVTSSGGTAIFNDTITTTTLTNSGGTATFNDAVYITSLVASAGTTTFNDTVTATGSLTIGYSTSTVTFNSTGNTFTQIAFGGNYGTIVMAEDSSLTFSTSQSTGNHLAISSAEGSVIDFDANVAIYGGSTWTITGDTENQAGGTINYNAGLQIGTLYSGTDRGNMVVGQYVTVNVKESLAFGADTYEGNLTVNGNFNSEVAIQLIDGASTITVGSTGVLTLGQGLTATEAVDTAGLTVTVDGVLQLGNQDDDTDYTSTLTSYSVIMNTNSTLAAYDTETTVYSTLSFADSAIVNLLADAGFALTLASAITAETSTINIKGEGTVEIAGGASVSGLTVEEDASLVLSSAVTVSTTVSVADGGSLTIDADASLSLGASVTSAGTITLSGGSLSLAGTSMTNDLVVTTDGGSLNADGDLQIDGSITYNSNTVGLDLSGVTGTITLGEGFSLALVDFDSNYSYVIFTGLRDDSLLEALNERITSINDIDVVWTYNEDGTITLSKDADVLYFNGTDAWENIDGDEGTWDTSSRLVVETITGDDITIETSDVQSGSVATLTLQGEGDVTLEAAISATKIAIDGGTLTLTGDDASLTGDITMVTGATLSTDGLTIVAATSDGATITGGSMTSSALTNTTVSNATLSIAGDVEMTGVSFDDSSMSFTSGSLTIGADTTIIDGGGASYDSFGADYDAEGASVSKSTGFTMTISSGSELSSNTQLRLITGSIFSLEGEGTYSVTSVMLGCGGTSATTLSIAAGTTMNITGANADWSGGTAYSSGYGFLLSNYNTNNIVTVAGILNVSDALAVNTGKADITVSGTLQLGKGLDIVQVSGQTGGESTITVQNGGTLELGTGTSTEASSLLSVSMEGGSTIKAIANTTIVEEISYAGTVKFESDIDTTLTMGSAVTNEEGTASITEGNVSFTGGATLGTLTVADGANFTVASEVTTTTLSGAGSVTVDASGSLAMGGASDFTGTLTLDGGTLTSTSGTVSTSLVVAADSALAGSTDTGILELSGKISYADNTGVSSLSVDGYELSLVEGFSVEISGLTLDLDTTYVVFEDLDNDISGSEYLDSTIVYGDETYKVVWTYDDQNLTLGFEITEYDEAIYDSSTGEITGDNIDTSTIDIAAGDDSELTITDTSATVGGLDISGESLTIGGEDLTSNGEITITGTEVLANTNVTATELAITDGGSYTLGATDTGDSADWTGSTVTLDENSSFVAGTITVEGVNSDAVITAVGDTTTLSQDSLTSVTIKDSAVSVDGDGSLVNTTLDSSTTLDVNSGALTLDADSSVKGDTTIQDGAALASGRLTIESTANGASIEDGVLAYESISNATISGAEMTVAATLLRTVDTVTISDTTIKDSSIVMKDLASLNLTNVTVASTDLSITTESGVSYVNVSGSLNLDSRLVMDSGVSLTVAEGTTISVDASLLSTTDAALTANSLAATTINFVIDGITAGDLVTGESYLLFESEFELSSGMVFTIDDESVMTVGTYSVSVVYSDDNFGIELLVSEREANYWAGSGDSDSSSWKNSDNWNSNAGLTDYFFTGLGATDIVDVDTAVTASEILIDVESVNPQGGYVFISSTGDELTTELLNITTGWAQIGTENVEMVFNVGSFVENVDGDGIPILDDDDNPTYTFVGGSVEISNVGASLVVAEKGTLNAGTLDAGDATDGSSDVIFTNMGTSSFSGAITAVGHGISNSVGTLTAGDGSVIGTLTNSDEGSVTLGDNTVIGEIDNGSNSTMDIGDDAELDTINNAGALTIGDGATLGTIDNAGALTIGDASTITSIFMNGEDSTLTVSADSTISIGSLTGTGTLELLEGSEATIDVWGSTGSIVSASTESVVINGFSSEGEGSGTLNVTSGNITITDADNLATLEVTSGNVTITDDGNLATLTIEESARVTIDGDAVIDSYSSPGSLSVTGSLELTGTVNADGAVAADKLIITTAILNDVTVNTVVFNELSSVEGSYSLSAGSITTGIDNVDVVLDIAALYSIDEITSEVSYIVIDSSYEEYYLITGGSYSWDDFVLSDNTNDAIEDLIWVQGKDVFLNDEDGTLTLVVQDSEDRTWETLTNTAVSTAGEGETDPSLTIDSILNADNTLTSYDILDTVDRIIVNTDTTISLEGVDKDGDDDSVMLNNLYSALDVYSLTLKGDGAGADSFTLTSDIDTGASFKGTMTVDSVTLVVDNDGKSANTVGTLVLTDSNLEVADGASFIVNNLTAEASSNITGSVTLSGGTSTLEGTYTDAILVATNSAQVTIDVADVTDELDETIVTTATGLTIKGDNGTYTLDNASGATLGAITTAGANVDLGTLTSALELTAASSMTGGTLSVSIGDTGLTSLISGVLDLKEVTISLGASDSIKVTDFTDANGTYTLVSLGDDVTWDDATSVVFDSSLAKYFSNASVSNGDIVATRNDSYYNNLGLTENGTSGLSLISKALAATELSDLIDDGVVAVAAAGAAANSTGDLGDVYTDLDSYIASGNTKAADTLAAAVAGATTTALGSAMMADVERQLRSTRNRTRSMGVDPTVVNPDMPYFNAWIAAEGSSSELDSDSTYAGHTLSNVGGAIGVEADLTDKLSMGISFTALMGDLSSDGADTADGDFDTMYASVYARVNSGRWTHSFVATYGMLDATLDRTVRGSTASYTTSGTTDGTAMALMYEVGYTIALTEDASTCIQPLFSMSFINSSVNGYTETGSDNANLIVGDQDNSYMTFGVGAALETVVGENIYNRASVLSTRLMLKADAGERTSEADISFESNSGASETIKGADVGAVGVEFGLGITIPVTEYVGAIFADVSVEARSGMTTVSGTVGYRFTF